MSFLEHLDELRIRLIVSCIALICGMAVSFFFVKRAAGEVVSSMLASRPLPAAQALSAIRLSAFRNPTLRSATGESFTDSRCPTSRG